MPQSINITEYALVTDEIRALEGRIKLLEEEKQEFLRFVQTKVDDVGCVQLTSATEIEGFVTEMKQDFIREIHCLDEGLPIYSKRCEILVMIKENQNYFGLDDKAILTIPSKRFPVEVVWRSSDIQKKHNYVVEAVEQAIEVHEKEPPGDIIIFLTSSTETEKAVSLLQNEIRETNKWKDLFCFQIHEQQDIQDQQEVFKQAPKGKRKIIFATNIAESSIVVDGVTYVIDSGMVRNVQYFPQKNASTLVVCLQSKCSAEQRKSCAGRTQTGKCFRLFSKANYENMDPDTIPEIMRIDISTALLKIKNVFSGNHLLFDFVENPPEENLKRSYG
ncbi:pre-mRNA-splicing factor ATP-dependent RNA helicase DEAH1-like [Limulus polyphemus]|uniref:Pre-mRNA-splicing factor ATP-dependent RNA helicase DEAH1-like n=1 Tax=Limulus polyphemus TaxID=6850 RepID=A0ABM1C037_LIMPO|nr:pre-mRNA-splicing factor ATP-dependent RNA helicase DEAH1-like [Limulus polyphemus]